LTEPDTYPTRDLSPTYLPTLSGVFCRHPIIGTKFLEGTMVNLVKHDLEFILNQIKIAERHAAGEDLRDLVAEAGGLDPNAATTPTQAFLLPYGLRTVDGSYNNLVEGRETWGAADQPFPVMSAPDYVNETDDQMMFGTPTNPVWLTNGNYTPGANSIMGPSTVVDADPRTISNLVADQTLNNPAAISAALTYAGIEGAAQMTAIAQIQAARAAIVQAQSSAGATPEQLAALATAVDTAEAALALAQADLAAAQSEASTDQDAHATAVANLAAAQLAVSNAQAVSNAMGANLVAAGNQLAAVQETLSQGQAAVDAALAQVTISTAAVATAQAAVTAATSALSDAQADLAEAQALAAADQTALTNAQSALADAEQDLADAQAELQGLIDNGAADQSEAIALAQAAVDAADLLLSEKQAAVSAAQTQVGVSSAAVTTAQGSVAAASAALATAAAELAPLQQAAAADQAAHQQALADLAEVQAEHDAAKATYDAIMVGGVTTAEMAAFNEANIVYIAAIDALELSQTAETAARTTAEASAALAAEAQADV
jgi:hypothetical protein